MDGNGSLDMDGIDRITESETVYEEDNGDWWEVQIVRFPCQVVCLPEGEGLQSRE